MSAIFFCIEGEDGKPYNFYDKKSDTWFTPTFTNRNQAVKFAIHHGIDCDDFDATKIKLVVQ